MKIDYKSVDEIKPYKKNPRDNSLAIEDVAKSIKEFGFQQPIVVDTKGVIIVGHTRFEAAKTLGLETVPVHVAENLTEDQARAYRISDNRTGEIATWDLFKLNKELETLSSDLFTGFDSGAGFELTDLSNITGGFAKKKSKEQTLEVAEDGEGETWMTLTVKTRNKERAALFEEAVKELMDKEDKLKLS